MNHPSSGSCAQWAPRLPSPPRTGGFARSVLTSRRRVATNVSVTPASKPGHGASGQLGQPHVVAGGLRCAQPPCGCCFSLAPGVRLPVVRGDLAGDRWLQRR